MLHSVQHDIGLGLAEAAAGSGGRRWMRLPPFAGTTVVNDRQRSAALDAQVSDGWKAACQVVPEVVSQELRVHREALHILPG